MAAQKSKAAAVKYRFQRFYPALHTGDYLTVQNKRQEPENVFFRQGEMCGACGLHVFSAVLVIFGLAKTSALIRMSNRKFGVPAEVWAAFKHTYFDGLHADEFVELVDSLQLPLDLTLRQEQDAGLDRWTVNHLMSGELVAITFASVKGHRIRHWSLCIGVEGFVSDRSIDPDTLLLLDPDEDPPSFRPHNARLALPNGGVGRSVGKMADAMRKPFRDRPASKPIHWLYDSPKWAAEPVRLLAAVRFRLIDRT